MDISIITSPSFTAFFIVRSIFLSVSTLLLVGVIYLLFVTDYVDTRWVEDLVGFFTQKSAKAKGMEQRWLKVEGYLKDGDRSQYKTAVMEAERLLEEALKKMGYQGDNLIARLGQLPADQISGMDRIRKAHQLRNNIAQDPDYQLSEEKARRALKIYKKALKELDVL